MIFFTFFVNLQTELSKAHLSNFSKEKEVAYMNMKRFLLVTSAVAFLVRTTFSGGTPNQQWFVQIGSGRENGDYVSATGPGQYITNNKYYAYFVEVPPATPRLVVEIFDPNIYEPTSGNIGEIQFGGSWNTTVSYTLISPSGTAVATLTGNNSTANNQQWVTLYDITNPQSGHWELRVQVVSGDDSNAYGIRAHDGDSGSGGRELNVYAESYVGLGVTWTGGPNPKLHNLYPYIIRGCAFRSMDFDNDNNTGSQVQFLSVDNNYTTTIPYTSLSGSATASGTGNDGWAFNLIT
ncbi:MAG: hypothetical protein N3A69_00100, partial [Leptospiraceae bacterium]|nr:hypothetical protein [Leptospiraceae bacterium]